MTNVDTKDSSCVQDSEGVAGLFLVGSDAFSPEHVCSCYFPSVLS